MFRKSVAAAFGLVICLSFSLIITPGWLDAAERSVEVTFSADLQVPADAKRVRLWIPYPMSDANQQIAAVRIEGNYTHAMVNREGRWLNNMVFAEWEGSQTERKITYTLSSTQRERLTRNFPKKEMPLSSAELAPYLQSQTPPAAEAKVKTYADRITKGKKSFLGKARANYDWIVDNMHRDPNVKGCGFGEVEQLLESLGGKCADIHSVFVALARASGVPAREIFGIRVPKGPSGDMTKAQHCWAEFYLPGYGWVVVDPADVTKAVLEQRLKTPEQVKPFREYYFGGVDENRIAFGIGRGIVLSPPQKGAPLNYFMYPYAEADGKPLNEDLFGFNLGYRTNFREVPKGIGG